MDWNKISEKSLGDRYTAIVGVLALLFIICSITIVSKGTLKDLWVLLGIITLLLALLTTQRGATVFLTAMVVYLHIASEDQRKAAQVLQRQLIAKSYIVPGIQNVFGQGGIPTKLQVRYFDPQAKESADSILKLIKSYNSRIDRELDFEKPGGGDELCHTLFIGGLLSGSEKKGGKKGEKLWQRIWSSASKARGASSVTSSPT